MPDAIFLLFFVTLCAEEKCPLFLGKATRLHWGLPDPASAKGDDTAILTSFRGVRDELHRRLTHVFSPGFLVAPTRYQFFTGKGGVGKTSLSAATAVSLADQGERVLLVSTDAASNLDEILGVGAFGAQCRPGCRRRGLPGSRAGPTRKRGDRR